jgi:uncharacterized protein involved in exopolysaccharide biosynthesis
LEDYKENNNNQQDIDFIYVVTKLYKHKIFIFSSTILVALFSVLYVLLVTPTYSTTLKMYSTIKGSGGPVNELIVSLGLSTKTSALYLPDLMKSRDVAKNVIKRKYLVDKDSLSLLEYWKLDKDDISENMKIDTAIKLFLQAVEVEKNNETELITLTVSIRGDKYLPMQIANALCDEVTLFLQKQYKNVFEVARIYSENRIKQAENELEVLEKEYLEFWERNKKISTPALSVEMNKRKEAFTLVNSVIEMLRKQRELLIIEEIKERPILNIIQQGSVHDRADKPQKRKIVVFNSLIGFFMFSLLSVAFERYRSEIPKIKKLFLNNQ